MPNYTIKTTPTGRSPENKFYFGHKTKCLDTSRPKYNKIGKQEDFDKFWSQMCNLKYDHNICVNVFDKKFRIRTNDDRHAQFIRNMFEEIYEFDNGVTNLVMQDWQILHNTELKLDQPKIYIHLDSRLVLIAGTTFLGEIKKGIFGIMSFELPRRGILPMHCSAFTYNNTTNLMFGLSGTGKTTLSSDPDFELIGDDEIAWTDDGIRMIEVGCYAKSEGLTPETHETIFNAVENAKNMSCLVVENPGVANARLSYPISMVDNAYSEPQDFGHANNIFFLTMDAEGAFPPISKISGETVRKFFETGYTSQMPGTEAGSDQITRVCSPCYGSPFMPRPISWYSDLLMQKITRHNCNVYLINTGRNSEGKRFPLPFTRNCIKQAIQDNFPSKDNSEHVLEILERILFEDSYNGC